MEAYADQIILVHCKILFSIVLQDFPINCSKSLIYLWIEAFFPHQWCLHAGRWFSICRAGVGGSGHSQSWGAIHFYPKQCYCYLPLASLADLLYRCTLYNWGECRHFFPKNLWFLLSFMNSRGLLLLLPVLDWVAKKIIQYTCCPFENALMALWPALQMPGFWKKTGELYCFD